MREQIIKTSFAVLLMTILVVVLNTGMFQDHQAKAKPLAPQQGSFNPPEDAENPVPSDDEETVDAEPRENDDDYELDESADDEEDEDYLEYEELEFERLEIESNLGRLELITRLAEIAKDDVAAASFAIMKLEEIMQDEEASIAWLKEAIESPETSEPIKNLLKMKLAEVYVWTDQETKAAEVLMSLIRKK